MAPLFEAMKPQFLQETGKRFDEVTIMAYTGWLQVKMQEIMVKQMEQIINLLLEIAKANKIDV